MLFAVWGNCRGKYNLGPPPQQALHLKKDGQQRSTQLAAPLPSRAKVISDSLSDSCLFEGHRAKQNPSVFYFSSTVNRPLLHHRVRKQAGTVVYYVQSLDGTQQVVSLPRKRNALSGKKATLYRGIETLRRDNETTFLPY